MRSFDALKQVASFEKLFNKLLNKNGTISFATGDRVKAFGNVGIVKSISANGMFLEVQFPEAKATTVFTICGRVHAWNKRPSLEKV